MACGARNSEACSGAFRTAVPVSETGAVEVIIMKSPCSTIETGEAAGTGEATGEACSAIRDTSVNKGSYNDDCKLVVHLNVACSEKKTVGGHF